MVSERRNELIAEMLHRVHFIEKWGRGIKLILSKEPDTKSARSEPNSLRRLSGKVYIEGTELPVKRVAQKIPRKYPKELTGNQLRLLALLEKDGGLTREQLAEKSNTKP